MNKTIDILSLRGQDRITNYIKRSDLSILINELENKKVKINLITNVSDLTFKNPIYVHDFTGCFNDRFQFRLLMDKFYIIYKKITQYSNDKNKEKTVQNILGITIPRIFFGSISHIDPDSISNINILKTIIKSNTLVNILPFSIINYVINRRNFMELIQTYMRNVKVTKAFIRFNHGHHPSYLVDLNYPESFDIDIEQYIGDTLSRQMIMIHPIKSEELYMKGVISLIYIDGKYSHAIIKKPLNTDIGIRKYSIKKHSPSYTISRIGKTILNSVCKKEAYNYSIVQINIAYTDDIYENAVSKINYIDPKLYLETHKKYAKKIRKNIITRINEFDNIIQSNTLH